MIFHMISFRSGKICFYPSELILFLILGAWLYMEPLYIGHVCSQCPVPFAAVSNHIQAAQCPPPQM